MHPTRGNAAFQHDLANMIQPLDMLIRSPGISGDRTDAMIRLADDIEQRHLHRRLGFRMPDHDSTWDDLVRGPITFAADQVPDYVLVRANGEPLYTLVNPVDDALMRITHVLRGEDLLSSTPRQIALYDALAAIGVSDGLIIVVSGPGGVGKSTTAVNLALALAAEGAQVGLLDADIYGPSQPMMMGIDARPETEDGKTMEPLENFGVQVMSIGFLINPDEAMIWRGPMATQALEQLLRQTNWKDLDYLIVDMPPGTGDIHLSLVAAVPINGVVIVSTPQQVALADARKGVGMFQLPTIVRIQKDASRSLNDVRQSTGRVEFKHPDARELSLFAQRLDIDNAGSN